MKRFFALISVLCIALTAAADNNNNTVVMKAVKCNSEFTKIAVGPAIKVFVEDRTEGNIIIRATKSIIDDVKLEVSGDELSVSYNKDMHFNKKSGHTFAEVYIPNNGKLCDFTVAAAAIVEVKPKLSVKRLNIECIGASVITLAAEAESAEAEIVGASNATLDIVCTKLNCELMGAAKATINGSATEAEFDICGASTLKAAEFKASQLKADIAGASKANLSADMADIEVSGASNAHIDCSTLLKADAAGASSIRYTGKCQVNIENNSGASKIKREE